MALSRARPNPVNNRTSGLRASVLDAAIELGIGNDTVAKWIFDPVEEEDEEEEEQPKTAVETSVTPPSNVSEESHRSIPPEPHTSGQYGYIRQHPPHDVLYSNRHSPSFDSPTHGISFGASSPSQLSHTSSAAFLVNRTLPKHNKLRKSRPDGYTSDGVYMTGPKKKSKKEKVDRNGYESEGDSASTQKKKVKASRDPSMDGEESDGGYLSETTKKRYFFARNRKKSQTGPERPIVPPLPSSSSLSYPKPGRFGNSRSVTPNTFTTGVASTRGSFSVEVHDYDYSRSTTPTATKYKPREESVQGLTKAFRDDTQSIAESVDWSNAYSHFPRIVPSKPPLPTHPSESSTPEVLVQMPEVISSPPRAPKTRPSPLLFSPSPSGYSHASEVSPVPSEKATITREQKSTSAVRHALVEAASITQDISWKPQTSIPTPPSSSSSVVTPSSEYLVPDPNSPLPSPGGSLRPPRAIARYDVPPPSPPPSGPLPRLPTPPEAGSSRIAFAKFGPSHSGRSSPVRNVNPALTIQRGKETQFSVKSILRVDDQLPPKNPSLGEGYDKRVQMAMSSVLPGTGGDGRIPPTGSLPPVPHHKKSRPPDIRVDYVEDDGASESISNEDVDSALSNFRKQTGIQYEEDDMEYLDMIGDSESEKEEDEEDMAIRDYSSLLGGDKSVKARMKLVKNVEAMHTTEGREWERRGVNVGRAVAPHLPLPPPPPPRSILRNPHPLKI